MKVRSISVIVFLLAVLSAGASGLPPTDRESSGSLNQTDLPEASRSLVEFAERALEYVRENGKERALEEFNNKSGQFVVGDLRYVFAYDFDGTCLAHPLRPESVGENLIDLRDANGFLLVRNLNRLASQGGG
ncbi:MAG TPA: cache domain-containing protein, partial [Methanothrix sp.]|nr:cache domain-containing protein [Methanothrix sp.]